MKKLALVLILIAGLTYASLLDSNDMKIFNMQGLAANPAVIGLNKQASVALGLGVMANLNQNAKLLSQPFIGFKASGSNINPSAFSDAPKLFKYTSVFGKDNWFAVRYYYDSNVYPDIAQKLDANPNFKYNASMKDATETFSLILSRDLMKDLVGAVELGTNTYTAETTFDFNKASGMADIHTFKTSKPYYSLQLGLIKVFNPSNKLLFAHKFSQNRGLYVRDEQNALTYTDTEAVPNETSIGYVYDVNNSLELGTYYKMFWGTSYTTNKQGSGINDQNTVTKYPYNNLTVAADYKINDKLSCQGFYAYIRDYKKIQFTSAAVNGDDIDRGWMVNQIGGNVQYKIMKDGTILLGAYDSRLKSEDNDINWIIDETVTHVAFSYAL